MFNQEKFLLIRKVIIRFFVFLILLFILDRALGYLLKDVYFKQNHENAFKKTYSFENANQDILIIGASRAEHHYISQIFEDSLHMSCFNAGMSGHHLFYYDAVLKCVLKRYKPKIIVLDLTPGDLDYSLDDYARLSALQPYYKSHPEIRDLVLLKDKFEKFKLFSQIYTYNSTFIESVTGMLDLQLKKLNEEKLKGFKPLYDVVGDNLKNGRYIEKLDSNYIKILKTFINDCNNNNIKLFIVISPIFTYMENQSKTIEFLKYLANNYSIIFVDFSQDSFFLKNSNLFKDIAHLNINGANLFTKKVVCKIHDYLK